MGRSGDGEKGRVGLKAVLVALLVVGLLFLPVLSQAGSLSAAPGSLIVIDKNLMKMITPKSPLLAGSSPSSMSEVAENMAREHGLPPNLVKSIIQAESNGDAKGVSRRGAMGLMQLMPETAKEYRVSDPFDPLANIRGGVQYLRNLLREFSGDLSLALAAYNAGPGAVQKYQGIPPYAETLKFVRKVKDAYPTGDDLASFSVFPSKGKELRPVERISGKIYLKGSPRDLAIFLKKMR
jgi:soluble lytic murein transglycosylase